jgi:hypothetical protein
VLVLPRRGAVCRILRHGSLCPLNGRITHSRALVRGPAAGRPQTAGFAGLRDGKSTSVSWLTGHGPGYGVVVAKTVLVCLVAVVSLRVASRRTVGQWMVTGVAAAVAVGAIMGRTSVVSGQSVAGGAAVQQRERTRGAETEGLVVADVAPLATVRRP